MPRPAWQPIEKTIRPSKVSAVASTAAVTRVEPLAGCSASKSAWPLSEMTPGSVAVLTAAKMSDAVHVGVLPSSGAGSRSAD